MTSSSSKSVAALSAFACSWARGGHLPDPLLALVVVVDRVELRRNRAGPRPRAPSRRARPSASRSSAAARGGRRRPSPGRRARRPCAGSRREAAPAGSRRRRRAASSGARAPVASASGPTIIPGVSISERSGMPKASQSCMKRAALSAPALVIAPAICIGLFATIPIGRPSIRASAVTISGRERVAQEGHGALVGERLDHAADVVGAPAALRDDVAQRAAGSGAPSRRAGPGSRRGAAWRPPTASASSAPRRRRRRSAPARRSGRSRRASKCPGRRPRSSPGRPSRARCSRWRRSGRQQPASTALPAKQRPATIAIRGTRPESLAQSANARVSSAETTA